jgi:hypothetical protein
MAPLFLHPFSLDRMVRAVEKVRDRLLRATAALENAAVPYAAIGGNAVAGWVARVDEAAVRNTPDIDILLRRADFSGARAGLEKSGFIYQRTADVDMFIDGPTAKARDSVHVVYANEKVRPEDLLPSPDVTEAERGPAFWMLTLEALVRMKLTSYRLKDQVHIRDMLDVGLLDASWLARLPAELAARLKQKIDTPEHYCPANVLQNQQKFL